MKTNTRAFQDDLPQNHCWGCGAANAEGLHIKSTWDGEEAVCVWSPSPAHMAGPRGVLNGGIIATVIDCHSICTAVADAYRAEGRPIGGEPLIWYVTGSLSVRYQRPAPLDRPLRVAAVIAERSGRKTVVRTTVSAGGEECAAGEVTAIRVAPEWFRRYDADLRLTRRGSGGRRASGQTPAPLPPRILALLGGADGSLTSVVATTDPDGGPHTAPFGSLCAAAPDRLRFACDRRHQTFANLERDPRVTVCLLAPPDIAVSILGSARVIKRRMETAASDAVIEIAVEEVKDDFIPGAPIATAATVTFAEPLADFARRYIEEARSAS